MIGQTGLIAVVYIRLVIQKDQSGKVKFFEQKRQKE